MWPVICISAYDGARERKRAWESEKEIPYHWRLGKMFVCLWPATERAHAGKTAINPVSATDHSRIHHCPSAPTDQVSSDAPCRCVYMVCTGQITHHKIMSVESVHVTTLMRHCNRVSLAPNKTEIFCLKNRNHTPRHTEALVNFL